jgi:Kinase associated domain 1.
MCCNFQSHPTITNSTFCSISVYSKYILFCFSYTLRGKIFSENGKSCKLSFELEVCLINSAHSTKGTENSTHNATPTEGKRPADSVRTIVGVRRKRLTGDAWCYKKVCEEILTLTSSRSNPDDVEEVCEAKRVKV